ncbi:aminopeptidase N [Porticoccus sp. W117]|uniref:aminopeptidase N n=1 Tax=Porticoccus sp. W117 TaxID=3054777 RepID=UPI0025930ACC|nr:aminopeptidase N [Porticoccus sp. W117]MDM3870317.1 aminopeptidase N [Porticoccus sp. W117]
MKNAQPKTIYLKDYQPPNYLIDTTELRVELMEEGATVTATLKMRRNSHAGEDAPLLLHGIELELRELKIDGRVLDANEYYADAESLTIEQVPAEFVLESTVFIKPQENTSLEGLYKSDDMFCTQCEAEGFRKITYYLDRPDVMSEYTTTVVADKAGYPVLLSNGNPIDSGELDNGRHFVTWHDPFKKPSYLFALVAGDLEYIEDSFTTMSGRNIELRIFVEEKDIDKCDHAMRSLKKSMAWDEEVYGREYDLDIFMIVAVDAFNMGAMENKGLNIFNTSAVLAKTETTTDAAFQRVEAIVAHEYFHNWSGNRVTCRDWFQLSLKEGFTVFRDAEFSADMGSRVVKRVEDVSLLRTAQFSEDAGPMAHPVQPASFIEISNFYTLTVYEKGCEVVRMYHTLLGPELFREGSDLYFDRHDGQAATIEDFTRCMEEVSGRDLTQFKRWYSQAGTPRLDVNGSYDADAQTYTLNFAQSCPATPESAEKQPFHIPVTLGLVGQQGDLPLTLQGVEQTETYTDMVLEITESEQSFVFENVTEQPVPSLLRDFSAPVKLDFPYSNADLTFLMSRDSDGFNRWDACQKLATGILEGLVQAQLDGATMELDSSLVAAFRTVLNDDSLDPAMVALMLKLPSEAYLAEEADVIHVDEIHNAREFVRDQLAQQLKAEFQAAYDSNQVSEPYEPSAAQIAKRSLKNVALGYLMLADDDAISLARSQYDNANNMTDSAAALALLVCSDKPQAQHQAAELIIAFYEKWQQEALVVNQWFTVQAIAPQQGAVERVRELMQHPAFDIKNPNKVRSLIGAFCANNHVNFHRTDGAGYQLLADMVIELNTLNPQIAARLLAPLSKWQKQIPQRQQLMKEQLSRILATEELSKDVYEVVSKSLK